MNWDMIAAVGEALGAIAVVLSLLYLTRQLRQANDVARATFHVAQSANYRNLMLSQFTSPDIGATMRQGLVDPDSLDEHQRHLFATLMIEKFQHLQAQVEGADAGVVRDEMVEKWAHVIANWVLMPGGRRVWEASKDLLSAGTVAALEAALPAAQGWDDLAVFQEPSQSQTPAV